MIFFKLSFQLHCYTSASLLFRLKMRLINNIGALKISLRLIVYLWSTTDIFNQPYTSADIGNVWPLMFLKVLKELKCSRTAQLYQIKPLSYSLNLATKQKVMCASKYQLKIDVMNLIKEHSTSRKTASSYIHRNLVNKFQICWKTFQRKLNYCNFIYVSILWNVYKV